MYKEAWDKILDAKHIVLVSHIHPDGDTIGSNLALYNTLKNLGKKVSLFNATIDELPMEFDFLSGYSKIMGKLPKYFDLMISTDCGGFDRLGVSRGDFKIINIDHHISNENFGDINIVLPKASSAGMVVYKLFEANDISIIKQSAICLYTSIVEDTGFFRYGGIDESTFEIVAKLIKCGANPQIIAQNVKNRQSLSKIRLTAYMLSNFELHEEASIASIVFDKRTLKQTGAKRSDTKNIITKLREIVNVKVSVMLLEEDGFFKVSLRSDGDKDVSKISAIYGGGGHKGAAGFSIKGSDEVTARKEIIDRINKI